MVSGRAGIQTSRCLRWRVPHEDLVLLYVHTEGDKLQQGSFLCLICAHLIMPGVRALGWDQTPPLLTLRPSTTRGIESSNHLLLSDTGE